MGSPIEDPLEITLPSDYRAVGRSVLVSPGKLSTFRLMHDVFDPDRDRWFKQGGGMPRVTDGNEVKALVRGEETYADMAQSMRDAVRPDPQRRGPAIIYFAGWDFEAPAFFSMPMTPGDSKSTVENLLKAGAGAGTEMRAMIWANGPMTPFETPGPRFAIDGMHRIPTTRGVVDWKTAVWFRPPAPISDRPFHIGAHHQKIMITRGSGRVTAYLGGIDLDRKRLDGAVNPDPSGLGWEDVHCRVRGPAADDVLAIFTQRWDDHFNSPDNDANHDGVQPTVANAAEKLLRERITADQIPKSTTIDNQITRQSVQVCRTFHSKLYDRIPPGNQAGEKTIRSMITHAIGQAKQFIYIEDQYLFSMEVSDALKGAIAKPTFRWLICLIPVDGAVNGELGGQASHRRAQFINNLRNAPGGEKVKVFKHDKRFVHSKIYLIDDTFAIIGSANCNRRGMQHDSEVSAGIFDRASDKEETLHFARRLRMRLWATHLNIAGATTEPSSPKGTQEEFGELLDGVGSAVHWLKRPAGSRVSEYPVNDDLNLAISSLKAEKDKLRDKIVKSNVPPPASTVALFALDAVLAKFTDNERGVDNAWNELFDPGDP